MSTEAASPIPSALRSDSRHRARVEAIAAEPKLLVRARKRVGYSVQHAAHIRLADLIVEDGWTFWP